MLEVYDDEDFNKNIYIVEEDEPQMGGVVGG